MLSKQNKQQIVVPKRILVERKAKKIKMIMVTKVKPRKPNILHILIVRKEAIQKISINGEQI